MTFFSLPPSFLSFLALMWSLWGVRVFQLPACLCMQSQCQILHRGSGCCELCQHRSYGVSGQPLSAPFPEQTLLHVKDPAHSYRLNGRELSAKWAVPTVLPPPQSGQGGDAVPPQVSCRWALPTEFPHFSFLPSSVNDSLAIFHLLLSAAD